MPKVKESNYEAIIEHRIDGIPCRIGVVTYHYSRGTYSSRAETPDEYYGFCETEWDIIDRKGYLAPWLERIANDYDNEYIRDAIIDHFEG